MGDETTGDVLVGQMVTDVLGAGGVFFFFFFSCHHRVTEQTVKLQQLDPTRRQPLQVQLELLQLEMHQVLLVLRLRLPLRLVLHLLLEVQIMVLLMSNIDNIGVYHVSFVSFPTTLKAPPPGVALVPPSLPPTPPPFNVF